MCTHYINNTGMRTYFGAFPPLFPPICIFDYSLMRLSRREGIGRVNKSDCLYKVKLLIKWHGQKGTGISHASRWLAPWFVGK
jgi:hypothetical protein